MLRLGSFALTVPAVFLASHLACHSHDEDPSIPSLADVVYEGGTTDEGLAELLKLTPKPGSKRARFSAPAAGSKVEGVPTFEWTYGSTTGQVAPPRRPTFGFQLAHAHGTPMNGTAYLLTVSSASDPKLLRVFTKSTSYKPDAAVWDRVKKAAGGPLSAVVVTGLFESNKVVADGGPFEGDSISFEVAQ